MIYFKERPTPPIDELPVNVFHIDSNIHVFITNKKNIHLNLPLDTFCLNSVCDILVATSLESNDIAFFTLKEGKNLYTLDYNMTNDSAKSVTLAKNKFSHEQGYFTMNGSGIYGYMVKTFQEFVYVMNKKSFGMTIWDIGSEKIIMNIDLMHITGGIEVDYIYPSISNFNSGFILIDSN